MHFVIWPLTRGHWRRARLWKCHSNRMGVMIQIRKVIEQNISTEKYIFKAISAIWKMFLPFNKVSYNIQRVTMWEDKEWCCVTTDTIRLRIEKERAENKIAHWLMHFFDFSKLFVSLHNWKGSIVWLPTVLDFKCKVVVSFWYLRDKSTVKFRK